jgi:hypothetical protein
VSALCLLIESSTSALLEKGAPLIIEDHIDIMLFKARVFYLNKIIKIDSIKSDFSINNNK